MNVQHYEFLSQFLLESSGLALGTGKEYLLEARLAPLAQSLGLADFDALIQALKGGQDRKLSSAVTEAMTTNETSFFRDKTPFEDLKKTILPGLIQARSAQRKLRIWCAASSTGQEPYSLVMLINDHFPELASWSVDLVATDISQSMIDRARAGEYSQFDVQRGLPVQMLVKHFEQTSKGWQIKEALRRRVEYRRLNLLEEFGLLGQFDLVLCRNVLIYFEPAMKSEILGRIRRVMRPDGYLLLGAAETVLGLSEAFDRFRAAASAAYVPRAA